MLVGEGRGLLGRRMPNTGNGGDKPLHESGCERVGLIKVRPN